MCLIQLAKLVMMLIAMTARVLARVSVIPANLATMYPILSVWPAKMMAAMFVRVLALNNVQNVSPTISSPVTHQRLVLLVILGNTLLAAQLALTLVLVNFEILILCLFF